MMRGFVYIHNIKKVYIDFFNVMNIIHNNNDNNNRRLQGNPHNDHRNWMLQKSNYSEMSVGHRIMRPAYEMPVKNAKQNYLFEKITWSQLA